MSKEEDDDGGLKIDKKDILVVEWRDGRYAGKRLPAVQARNIIEPPLGEIREGSMLKIKMGKSASAKVWNATFVGKASDTEDQAPVEMDIGVHKNATETVQADSDETAPIQKSSVETGVDKKKKAKKIRRERNQVIII